jgi:hypothetical protein
MRALLSYRILRSPTHLCKENRIADAVKIEP